MILIELEALSNGAHRNQEGPDMLPPDGWAVVPDALKPVWLEYGPFVEVTCDASGLLVSMSPGVRPEPEPIPEPTETLTNEQLTQILKAMNGGAVNAAL